MANKKWRSAALGQQQIGAITNWRVPMQTNVVLKIDSLVAVVVWKQQLES